MLKNLTPLLKRLPPSTAHALAQAINKCGRELGIGPDWVQRWVAFTVVADALASYAPDGEPAFHFKGGAAIEMRMRQLRTASDPAPEGIRPRATKDLDATYRGALDDLEAAVRTALATARHNFAFRVELETPDAPHMRRFSIRVSYQEERFGRVVNTPFSNVQLEVSIYEGTPRPPEMVRAFSLKPFGLEGPESLPCIPLTKQIAQKIHAVTDPPGEGKTNDRFRDLLDIVMLSAVLPASSDLRDVCEETFAVRQGHPWPPDVVLHEHWRAPMEQRASEMGLDTRSADDIVAYVAQYIRDIEGAA